MIETQWKLQYNKQITHYVNQIHDMDKSSREVRKWQLTD